SPQIETAQAGEDSFRRGALGGDVRLQAKLAEGASRLRTTRDLSCRCQRAYGGLAQRRLVTFNAGKDAVDSLAGEEHQIIEPTGGEPAAPVQDRSRIGGIANGDHRAADHCGAAP